MIIQTAKEILRHAKWLANIRNSQTSDFSTSVNVLNSEFHKLYNDIVRETDAFTNEFEFSGKTVDLPDDCMYISGVYVKGEYSDNLYPVKGSPKGQYIPTEYKIENNKIRIIGDKSNNVTYVVKYCPLPPTITAPDEPEILDFDIDYAVPKNEVEFYYTYETRWYLYNTETKETESLMYAPALVETGKYGEDAYECNYGNHTFTLPEYFFRDGLEITWAQLDWPYAIISYSDGSIYLFTGEDGVEWNAFNMTGHPTRGIVYTMRTNDMTGKGLVYKNARDGKIYYCSFVPDTVLSYPQQIFFQLLAYKVGATLASIVGIDNRYLLEKAIPEAEVMFYDTLRKDKFQPTRIVNIGANRYERLR